MKKIFGRKYSSKKLMIAAIALLEAVILLYTITFAWIEGSKDSNVEDNECKVSAGSGIIFTGENITNGVLNLSNYFDKNGKLEDCSSVDGRNFFFPTTGNLNGTVGVFREGIDADKNTKYISADFYVTALSETGGDEVPIYIGNSSKVTTSDGNTDVLNALRISFNFNDGTTPVVICPGLSKADYTRSNLAILSVNASGAATTLPSTAYPMADYWYNGNKSLATVKDGESKRVTVSVWLEGTDESCTTASCALKNLNIDISLTTSANYSKKVTFVDYSPNRWVANTDGLNGINMYVIDKSTVTDGDYSTGAAYKMTKQSDGKTYVAYIPDNVTDVAFGRFNPDDDTLGYNYWATDTASKMNDSDIQTYYGIGQGSSVDGGINYGYWVNSSCTGVLDIYLTDNNDTFAVIDNNNPKYTPKLYFYDTQYGTNKDSSNHTYIKAWGGFDMRYEELNSLSQRVYRMIIPADTKTIVFNGNNNQTVNIDLTSSNYDKSGVTKVGFYINGSTTVYGETRYTCDTWDPSED